MRRFVSLARAACCTAFALVLASACGGHSASNGADSDPGDAGSGGVTSRAGSSSSGGSEAHAGSSSGGGGGGVVDAACSGPSTLDPDGSSCSAYFPRWTHDSTTGLCTPVMYNGCGASQNNYETLEACQKACPGGPTNYDECKAPTDCVLAAPGCCGVCDGPSISKHDFLAYNKLYEGKVPTCGNGNVACGACPNREGEATRKYFVPNCVNGECVVEDIRESDVTACTTSEDCRLRAGTACCESCGISSDVVAVRRDDSLSKLVCADGRLPCSTCQPGISSEARAICSADHCIVVYLLK